MSVRSYSYMKKKKRENILDLSQLPMMSFAHKK